MVEGVVVVVGAAVEVQSIVMSETKKWQSSIKYLLNKLCCCDMIFPQSNWSVLLLPQKSLLHWHELKTSWKDYTYFKNHIL